MAKFCMLASKISHMASHYKYAELDNELVNNVLVFLGWIKHIAPHGFVTVFGTVFSAVETAVAQTKKNLEKSSK